MNPQILRPLFTYIRICLTRATEQVDSLSLDDDADVNDIDDNNDDNNDDSGDITTITAQVKPVLMFSAAIFDIKGQPTTGPSAGQISVLKPVFKATVILQN